MSSGPTAPAGNTSADVVAEPSKAFVTVVVLCFGGLTASLVQTLVIPIQGELPRLLHTSAANSSWVITATLLAAAVAMPIAGRLGDMFGKQRVLLVSAVILLVGSAICAMSSTLLPMLVGRALQGLAMGFIPVGISLMREVTPPRMTATAIASMSATLGVGGAIGLPLSAWVADAFNWHALFWMSAALALLVAVAVATLVPNPADAVGGRLDVVGTLGLSAGLILTLIAVSKGNSWGWDQPRTLGTLAGGIVVLLLWGWFELRVDEPLADLRLTAQLPVLLTNLAAVAIGFGMMAQAIVVPQLLQLPEATGYGLGLTILQAGLLMAPGGLMMMLFAPVSSRLIQGAGAKRTLVIGASVLGSGYVVAAFFMHTPIELLVASCVASAGVGIGYAAMPTLIMASVPMREAGSAVGINGLMRSIGTTVASAVMAALLTSSTQDFGGFALPTESAFRTCFIVGAGAAFIGALIAASVPFTRRAAEQSKAAAAGAPQQSVEVQAAPEDSSAAPVH
ncbi:MAG: putative major facilitator superfamily transporter [Marmoricola sp.]|nr:putative major facilitator superfamily transporter [Marmoricola sp.]